VAGNISFAHLPEYHINPPSKSIFFKRYIPSWRGAQLERSMGKVKAGSGRPS